MHNSNHTSRLYSEKCDQSSKTAKISALDCRGKVGENLETFSLNAEGAQRPHRIVDCELTESLTNFYLFLKFSIKTLL